MGGDYTHSIPPEEILPCSCGPWPYMGVPDPMPHVASCPLYERPALYRVTVDEGRGSFLLDVMDVGRFAQRMAQEGDERPFTIVREPGGSAYG